MPAPSVGAACSKFPDTGKDKATGAWLRLQSTSGIPLSAKAATTDRDSIAPWPCTRTHWMSDSGTRPSSPPSLETFRLPLDRERTLFSSEISTTRHIVS